MKVRPGFGGLCYVGTDPTGRGGVIRIPLSQMTNEQLNGWLNQDYNTASRYIDGEPEAIQSQKVDNQQGQPLPKKPEHEAQTNTGNAKGFFSTSKKAK